MPTIKITDHLNAELLTADANPASGFAKYFQGQSAKLTAVPIAVKALMQPVALASAAPLNLGLTFQEPVAFGASDTELSVGAGLQAQVGVAAKSGEPLFDQEYFGDPITVPDGKAYVSFSLMPSIKLGAAHPDGDLTFGFKAGTSMEIRSCHLVDVAPSQPTVGAALQGVLSDFCIPGDVEDLRRMPPQSVASVSGQGKFTISGSYDLATGLNPLATPKLPIQGGSASLKAGASLVASVSCGVSGDYQIRVQKTATDTVRLGLHRKAGSQFTFDLDGSLGASATFGKRDLFRTLVRAISTDPAADIEALVNADLSDAQIDNFTQALTASINRNLTLSLETEFTASGAKEAAFLYEVKLDALDAAAELAVHRALDGNFSALTLLDESGAPGITVLRSTTKSLRKRRVTLRVNLLGIVNAQSMTTMIRSGSVTYEPVTGDLVIADKLSTEKIRQTSRPFEAAGEKLRRAVFESLIVTAAYRGSKLISMHEFTCSQTYFEFHQNTNTQTMADNLEAALFLIPGGSKAALMGGLTQFGASTFLLGADYDTAAFRALFVDAAGLPYPRERYERIGRDALLALVAEDPGGFRHIPIRDDNFWMRMPHTPIGDIASLLPAALRQQPQLGVVRADWLLITWWADSMSKAARALTEMERFLAGADPATMRENNDFKKRQKALIDSLGDAMADNQSQFGDPWGLLALDAAADRKAIARAVVVSPRLTMVRSRP